MAPFIHCPTPWLIRMASGRCATVINGINVGKLFRPVLPDHAVAMIWIRSSITGPETVAKLAKGRVRHESETALARATPGIFGWLELLDYVSAGAT
jgi:hypothetical protein